MYPDPERRPPRLSEDSVFGLVTESLDYKAIQDRSLFDLTLPGNHDSATLLTGINMPLHDNHRWCYLIIMFSVPTD